MDKVMTDQHLTEIETRLNGRIPNKWDAQGNPEETYHTVCREKDGKRFCSILNKQDLVFIAGAPADISALLAEVRRLKAALNTMKQTQDWFVGLFYESGLCPSNQVDWCLEWREADDKQKCCFDCWLSAAADTAKEGA